MGGRKKAERKEARRRRPVLDGADDAAGGGRIAPPPHPPESGFGVDEGDPTEVGTRLGFLIHDVSRMRRTLYDQAVRPLGLTRSQWWLLVQVSRHAAADGLPQTELARLLDVGKVTVGGLVDRLEERGYVERRADEGDRRAKRVLVTPGGRKVLKRMVRLSDGLNATMFAGFGPAELRLAEQALERMKDNVRAALGER